MSKLGDHTRPRSSIEDGLARLGRLSGFRVAATGSFLPPTIVTNHDLAKLGCDSDWIVQRTGILERRVADRAMASSDLAYEAAIDCLNKGSILASDIDLIVVATITPDHFTPSTACRLQYRLGATAPAFDINAACSGFFYALTVAGHFVVSGLAKKALVVGSEIMSRTVCPEDRKTYPLFGDGAGAALLVSENFDPVCPNGLLAYQLGASGEGGDLLCIPAGGSREPLDDARLQQGRQYFQMDGRTVFKWAVRTLVSSIKAVMSETGLQPKDIQQFLLHQANRRIIDAAIDAIGLPLDQVREKVMINLDRYGNTSAASLAIALDEAATQDRIRRGDLILLSGFGAGLTWGTGIMRW